LSESWMRENRLSSLMSGEWKRSAEPPRHSSTLLPILSELAASLRMSSPLEVTDPDFHGTPLDWAIHGSQHGWHSSSGNHAATVETLLKSGARVPNVAAGTETVREVLRRYAAKDQSAPA
jgi:hypothetical protein